MSKTFCSLSLSVLLSTTLISPIHAQVSTNVIPQYHGKHIYRRQPKPVATMKEPMLPDVPRFPQAKYVTADETGKGKDVPVSFTIEYSIPKSSEAQVIPWYASLFSGGGWKIVQQNDHAISANKEKPNTDCTVFIDSDDEAYSRLHVSYAVAPLPNYSY